MDSIIDKTAIMNVIKQYTGVDDGDEARNKLLSRGLFSKAKKSAEETRGQVASAVSNTVEDALASVAGLTNLTISKRSVAEETDRDGISTEVLKSYADVMRPYGLTGMLSREAVDVEVDKILGDPKLLEIPTKTFDDTEEETTDGEDTDSSTDDDTVGEAQDNQPNLDDAPTGGLMSPDRSGVQTGTTVKEAQQTLTDLGYKPQGVDGVLGKGSARAIRKLQKAADLPITGELTEEVIALLKSGNAPAYFDPPKKDAKVENISDSMFDVFKEAIAQKESSGRYSTYGAAIPKLGIKKGDPLYGGANMHYLGRYQMGKVALQDVGRGYSKTLNQAFLDDPDLQDKLFKKYTLQNHKTLTKNSKKYRDMSVKEKLGVLGYAHNQGAVSAEEWLYTGVSGADGLGTKGDEYTSLVRDAFAEESPDDMPN